MRQLVELSTGSLPAALLASGAFAFTPLVWHYAIQAEVFALNNLLAVSLLYLTARYARAPSDTTACLGAFVIGLGMSNQHTIVFYALPCAAYVLYVSEGSLYERSKMAGLVGCGLLGLAPYAYLPLASPLALHGSWGEVDNIGGFLVHVLRQEYGTFRLFSGAEAHETRFMIVHAPNPPTSDAS